MYNVSIFVCTKDEKFYPCRHNSLAVWAVYVSMLQMIPNTSSNYLQNIQIYRHFNSGLNKFDVNITYDGSLKSIISNTIDCF